MFFLFYVTQMLRDIHVPHVIINPKLNVMHAPPVAIQLTSELSDYVVFKLLFMRLCHISGSI